MKTFKFFHRLNVLFLIVLGLFCLIFVLQKEGAHIGINTNLYLVITSFLCLPTASILYWAGGQAEKSSYYYYLIEFVMCWLMFIAKGYEVYFSFGWPLFFWLTVLFAQILIGSYILEKPKNFAIRIGALCKNEARPKSLSFFHLVLGKMSLEI